MPKISQKNCIERPEAVKPDRQHMDKTGPSPDEKKQAMLMNFLRRLKVSDLFSEAPELIADGKEMPDDYGDMEFSTFKPLRDIPFSLMWEHG